MTDSDDALESPDERSVTELLLRYTDGDPVARAQLLERVYDELRALADSQLRGQRQGHTLQPTALVHEAYLKLIEVEASGFAGRRHFYALAAQVMRAMAPAGGSQARADDAEPSRKAQPPEAPEGRTERPEDDASR